MYMHIFPTFFHNFFFALWAQRAPPRPPLPKMPPKVCVCLLIQVSYLKTMFCHTSPVILTLFWGRVTKHGFEIADLN